MVKDSVGAPGALGWWDTLGAASPYTGKFTNPSLKREELCPASHRASFYLPMFSVPDLEMRLLSSHSQCQGGTAGQGTHLWYHLGAAQQTHSHQQSFLIKEFFPTPGRKEILLYLK